MSNDYNPITGAKILARPSTSKDIRKHSHHWNGRIDVLSGILKDSRKLAPHYLKKNRQMIANNKKAFFKAKGEFTKIYDMAHNHKFISRPFIK